jgi:transcription-repair coupling factor (superfamily II helicase)
MAGEFYSRMRSADAARCTTPTTSGRVLESEFPYRETDDQRTAIEAVMEDLEARHPMDHRLVATSDSKKEEAPRLRSR